MSGHVAPTSLQAIIGVLVLVTMAFGWWTAGRFGIVWAGVAATILAASLVYQVVRYGYWDADAVVVITSLAGLGGWVLACRRHRRWYRARQHADRHSPGLVAHIITVDFEEVLTQRGSFPLGPPSIEGQEPEAVDKPDTHSNG